MEQFPSQQLISIGMIVYNGATYLREAIESVLAQEYTHFELIIADDASTDTCGAICQEYAERDHRIIYYRNPVNLGVYQNFWHAFELTRGEFFLWMAQDDIWHSAYLKELVTLLAEHPSAVLAGCQVTEIWPDKSHACLVPLAPTTLGMTIMQRLSAYICHTPHAICHLIYGLWRRDVLAGSKALRLAARVNDPKVGFDHLIIFDCLLDGDIVISEKPLFIGRILGLSYYIEQYISFPQRVIMFAKFAWSLHLCFRWSRCSFSEQVRLFAFCLINDWEHLGGFLKQTWRYHLSPVLAELKRSLDDKQLCE